MRHIMLAVAVATLTSACGGGSDSASAPGEAAPAAAKAEELPLRSGDVWEVDPQSNGSAQMLAYLNGLHAFVRQGDDIYTATTRLSNVKEDGGVLTAKLLGGIEAKLEDKDNQHTLTFSSGQSASLRQHQAAGAQQ